MQIADMRIAFDYAMVIEPGDHRVTCFSDFLKELQALNVRWACQ
ncbi:hypothetical protein SAMN05216516_102427 [Izhakiella capsodis]|uniref:Uncharacterized protein n=1 Tax=Izhakiella capsodis TaxID=1367852 RepID=A0A1I4WCA9_9GAMM|nr:hypothetical protein SAMN05216516_102427 [Izhakiella capsodis]